MASDQDDTGSFKVTTNIPDVAMTTSAEIYLCKKQWRAIHSTDSSRIYDQDQNLKMNLRKIKEISEKAGSTCSLRGLIYILRKEKNSITDKSIKKEKGKRGLLNFFGMGSNCLFGTIKNDDEEY